MKRLSNKITLVAGDEERILHCIVSTLLAENATVIVPAKSADEVMRLKDYLRHIVTSKLVTCLIDNSDPEKIQELTGIIKESFGAIDLAIICFASAPPSPGLINTNMADWERMIERNITAPCISGAILLKNLNGSNGLYISICNVDDFVKKPGSALANISAAAQTGITKIFYEEIAGTGLRYHQLLINYTGFYNQDNNPVDDLVYAKRIGEFILQLYEGKTGSTQSLFQSLPGESFNEKDLAF